MAQGNDTRAFRCLVEIAQLELDSHHEVGRENTLLLVSFIPSYELASAPEYVQY